MQLLINAYYMQERKVDLPEHKASIEKFEQCATNMIQMFTDALQTNHDLRESVLQEFSATMDSKDRVIQNLQDQMAELKAAKENAALNGLDNCTFWAGDVLKVIDDLGEVPDLIVLDPPRDGVHPKALEKIIDFGVERMVYIACKPTSLARDLELLQGRGYQVERIGCVDLFPSTVHVETVCLLSNKKVKDKDIVEIGVDTEDYYKIKKGK